MSENSIDFKNYESDTVYEILADGVVFTYKNFLKIVSLFLTPIAIQILALIIVVLLPIFMVGIQKSSDSVFSVLFASLGATILSCLLLFYGLYLMLDVTYRIYLASYDYKDKKPLDFNKYKAIAKKNMGKLIKLLCWVSLYILIPIFTCMGLILVSYSAGFGSKMLSLGLFLVSTLFMMWICFRAIACFPVLILNSNSELKAKEIFNLAFKITKNKMPVILGLTLLLFLINLALQFVLGVIFTPIADSIVKYDVLSINTFIQNVSGLPLAQSKIAEAIANIFVLTVFAFLSIYCYPVNAYLGLRLANEHKVNLQKNKI